MSLTTGFGNTFCQKSMDKLLSQTNYTPPTSWYAAMLTADATDDDGSTLVEVTTGQFGGYARVTMAANTTNFPLSSIVSHVATTTTGAAIDWGAASSGSGCTVVGVALYDASTSGNLGPWGPLGTSKILASGDGFKINSGNGTFTMS